MDHNPTYRRKIYRSTASFTEKIPPQPIITFSMVTFNL